MTIAELTKKMIEKTAAESQSPHHDINHFLKVWAYARTIGQLEGLTEEVQYILEAAAIIHDISIPYCRDTYGSAAGKLQERESGWITARFLSETDISAQQQERIIQLVSRHHTYENVDGPDCQILLEADYLVNAEESGFSSENIKMAKNNIFKTRAGLQLLTTENNLQDCCEN